MTRSSQKSWGYQPASPRTSTKLTRALARSSRSGGRSDGEESGHATAGCRRPERQEAIGQAAQHQQGQQGQAEPQYDQALEFNQEEHTSMAQPFLALITPVSGGNYPDQSLPGDQPRPTHPIYYPPGPGTPPLGIWGGRPPEYVDIGGPGNQPAHGQNLPGNPAHPRHGAPGPQPRPDQGPAGRHAG